MQKKKAASGKKNSAVKKQQGKMLRQNGSSDQRMMQKNVMDKRSIRVPENANGPPKTGEVLSGMQKKKSQRRMQYQQERTETKSRLQFEKKDLDGSLGKREPEKQSSRLQSNKPVNTQKQAQKKRNVRESRQFQQLKADGIQNRQGVSGDTVQKSMSGKTEEKQRKRKQYQKAQEDKGKSSSAKEETGHRLKFQNEEQDAASLSGVKRAGHLTGAGAAYLMHRRIRDAEEENAAVEAAYKAEMAGEHTWKLQRYQRSRANRTAEKRSKRQQHRMEQRAFHIQMEKQYRTYFEEHPELEHKRLQKIYQKQRIKREYMKAYRAGKVGGAVTVETIIQRTEILTKVARKTQQIIVRNSTALVGGLLLLILLLIVMTGFSSCSMFLTDSVSNVVAVSYLADPEEIEQAELYYTEMEAKLQAEINRMEALYPGHEEYRYNIGMIGHDPHVLIGYLTAKYGDFTFEQVKDELEALFEAQYGITVEETTETREETSVVRVGESLGMVVTSGYCSCSICCGIWSGGPTASGVMPKANHTIAVDASDPFLPMGTKVVMNGVEYTVEDTGNFARYGVQFDVYYDNHNTALMHGHRSWECFLAEGNENSVEVTRTVTADVANVSVQAKSLGMMVTDLMDREEAEIYENVYGNKGNLQVYETPIELNWYAYISNYYGYSISNATGQTMLRRGVDINVNAGREVQSAMDGIVTKVGYDNTFGNYVVTQDEDGCQIKYAYLQSISVSKGDTVTKDTVIGKTGSTGSATGSQLYLELLKDGTYYNPIFYIETGEGGLYGSGIAYDNETVRRLFAEAERYLGMPYVWGGSSPATSFDCSGFVSYVFTNSGVCNMGRLTAQGIYNICTPISPAEAQPGDIIFFTGTYNAGEPVTHVGIYAGNGQMIHCGDPIQYTSINSSYWQSHFYGYGRPN